MINELLHITTACVIRPNELLLDFINRKYREYHFLSRLWSVLYYISRITVGISAAILPFIVSNPANTNYSIGVSVTIAILTTLDLIFKPKDKWIRYSRASNDITMKKISKMEGAKENKEIVEILLKTENEKLKELIEVNELREKIEKQSTTKDKAN